MMTLPTLVRTPVDMLRPVFPLLALGVGFVGLYRTMQAVSDLIAVLECSGAMGGTRETA